MKHSSSEISILYVQQKSYNSDTRVPVGSMSKWWSYKISLSIHRPIPTGGGSLQISALFDADLGTYLKSSLLRHCSTSSYKKLQTNSNKLMVITHTSSNHEHDEALISVVGKMAIS